MFGGNGNEGEEIRKIAERIINEITPEENKRKLRDVENDDDIFDEIKKSYDDIKGKIRQVMPTGG